jgi:hypothetical protein
LVVAIAISFFSALKNDPEKELFCFSSVRIRERERERERENYVIAIAGICIMQEVSGSAL